MDSHRPSLPHCSRAGRNANVGISSKELPGRVRLTPAYPYSWQQIPDGWKFGNIQIRQVVYDDGTKSVPGSSLATRVARVTPSLIRKRPFFPRTNSSAGIPAIDLPYLAICRANLAGR